MNRHSTDRPWRSSTKIPQFRGTEVRGHTAVLKSAETQGKTGICYNCFIGLSVHQTDVLISVDRASRLTNEMTSLLRSVEIGVLNAK